MRHEIPWRRPTGGPLKPDFGLSGADQSPFAGRAGGPFKPGFGLSGQLQAPHSFPFWSGWPTQGFFCLEWGSPRPYAELMPWGLTRYHHTGRSHFVTLLLLSPPFALYVRREPPSL